MSRVPPELRRRQTPGQSTPVPDSSKSEAKSTARSAAAAVLSAALPKDGYNVIDIVVLLVLAAIPRFWRIDEPDSVVFDEFHFGKFTNW